MRDPATVDPDTLAPRPARHPFLALGFVVLLGALGVGLYRHAFPHHAPVPTPTAPDGDWVGELTMDGRQWNPLIDGDTPGPHRHAVFHFRLETTDSFLDHHAGDGTLQIVGEGITRPFRAFGWEPDPDGSLQFGMLSTPYLFQDEFHCQVDASHLTCKDEGPLQARLTLHPGPPAEADTLLRQVTQRAAAEPAPTPLPTYHDKVLCSDDHETITVSVSDSAPKPEGRSAKPARPHHPPACKPSDEE